MGSTNDSKSISRKLAAPGGSNTFSASLVTKPSQVEPTVSRCIHFAKLRACQLQFSAKCCACADSRPKTDRASNGKHRSFATSAPFYQHYCKGCCNYFSQKEETRRQSKIAHFRLWQKDPSRDSELSILYVNFLLRRGLGSVPFEVVHVILAFTYVNPPIAWFRSFDRPQLEAKVLKQQTLNWKKKGTSAIERGHACNHTYCQLGVAKAKAPTPARYTTTSRYATYYTSLPLGCCACMDRRPAATRSMDVVYIDGKGDTVIEVPFYRHYCPGCRDHYEANPRDYPFVDA